MLIDATRWQVQFLLSSAILGRRGGLCNLKLSPEYVLISLNRTVLNENNLYMNTIVKLLMSSLKYCKIIAK
jgi:hypothetical protein